MRALFRLVGFVALLWLGGFVWFASMLPRAAPVSVKTDAVVVLTGGPGRLARGLDVLEAGSAKRLLVSGVDDKVDKGDLAQAAAARRSLFAARVDLGHEAVDTRSNAEETAAWVARHEYRTLRLVTSAAHMRRAMLELDKVLPPEVAILPDAVPQEPAASGLAREYSKYALRRLLLGVGAA